MLKRKRQTPHLVGNFASYVYFKVPWTEDVKHMQEKAVNVLQSLSTEKHHVEVFETDLHISISAMIYLNLQFIDSFIASLRDSLHNMEMFEISVFDTVSLFWNEDASRLFAGTRVTHADVVDKFINQVEKVTMEYFFQRYPFAAKERYPHVSLASFSVEAEERWELYGAFSRMTEEKKALDCCIKREVEKGNYDKKSLCKECKKKDFEKLDFYTSDKKVIDWDPLRMEKSISLLDGYDSEEESDCDNKKESLPSIKLGSYFLVDRVYCKVGKTEYEIPLKKRDDLVWKYE